MADNDVTVRYVLKDDATSGLKRIEGQAEATKRSLRNVGSTNGPLLTFFDALDGKLGNLDKQLSSLDKTLMSTSRTMQHDLIIGLRNVTLGLTAAAGAADFFGLRAVNSFQHTMAAFSVLTGSLGQGQQLYQQLLQLNLHSPFDQQPLAQSAQTLLGFRIPQQQLMPLLTNISNVAAVQQDPNEALQRMSLAVGQIAQSGIVRAQDLNQLVQAGFPAYRLIPGGHAALVGGSSGGGRMPSGQFINALTDPNNSVLRPYAGASQAMNMTLSGQWSNLTTMMRQEAIKDFSGMGSELVKQMPQLTNVLTGALHDIAPELVAVGGDIIKGAEALLPILEPIAKSLLHGLHELFSQGAPFLRELRQQDPAITAAIGHFFGTLAANEGDITALFIDMVQLLPPFLRGLDDMITLVDPVLKLVDGLLGLGPVRTFVADLLVSLLAYRTLAPAIKAVLGMRDAMFGLAAAETAAATAGGAGGVAGRRGAMTAAEREAASTGRFRGALNSAKGGAGVFGPEAFAFAMLLGPDIDYSTRFGHYLSNKINPMFGKAPAYVSPTQALGKDYMARGPAWADAIANDPRLHRMIDKYDASINIASGAIVVHGAKDPVATAQAVRDEIQRFERDRTERQ